MEEQSTLRDNIKDYVDTQINIIKLKAISKGGAAISGIIVGVALAVLSIFILMFLSFSAAYAISDATEKPFLGFLLVGAFYILLAILIIALKDKLLTIPIINSLLQKFYFTGEAEK